MKLQVASTAAVTLAALSLNAASASAGLLIGSTPCPDQQVATPFAPWLDAAKYSVLPGGDFEGSAAGWTLSAGAAIASGSESFHVRGASDHLSLSIPSGASATSPAICVGLEHPTMRFFARSSGDLPGVAAMQIDVLFRTVLGSVSAPIGVVTPSSSWQPTLALPVVANLLALVPGDHTQVSFRFTPLVGGWSIDDVHVDPYGRR